MKNELIDLFTKRIIDYSLIDWIELLILFIIFIFIIAIFKTIISNI